MRVPVSFVLLLGLLTPTPAPLGAARLADADTSGGEEEATPVPGRTCVGKPEGELVNGRTCAGKLIKRCPKGKRCQGQRRKQIMRETKVVEKGLDGIGKRLIRETVVSEFEVKDLPEDVHMFARERVPKGVTYYQGNTFPRVSRIPKGVDGFTLMETASGLQYVENTLPNTLAPGAYGAPRYVVQPEVPVSYGAAQYIAQPQPPLPYVQYVQQPVQPQVVHDMQPPPTYRVMDYMPSGLYDMPSGLPTVQQPVQPHVVTHRIVYDMPPSYYDRDRRPYDEPQVPNYGFDYALRQGGP